MYSKYGLKTIQFYHISKDFLVSRRINICIICDIFETFLVEYCEICRQVLLSLAHFSLVGIRRFVKEELSRRACGITEKMSMRIDVESGVIKIVSGVYFIIVFTD
jgi:hypothetical protein